MGLLILCFAVVALVLWQRTKEQASTIERLESRLNALEDRVASARAAVVGSDPKPVVTPDMTPPVAPAPKPPAPQLPPMEQVRPTPPPTAVGGLTRVRPGVPPESDLDAISGSDPSPSKSGAFDEV